MMYAIMTDNLKNKQTCVAQMENKIKKDVYMYVYMYTVYRHVTKTTYKCNMICS